MIWILLIFLLLLISALLFFLLGIGYFIKHRPGESRIPKIIFWSFGISVALCIFLWFAGIQPLINRGRQVRTIADMQAIAEYLIAYRDRNGDFPAMFTDAIPANLTICCDGWKNSFHYEHRPGAFVLVSFGSDGKSDGTDYWQLRENNTKKGVDGKFFIDQVVSDRGWHRAWGM